MLAFFLVVLIASLAVAGGAHVVSGSVSRKELALVAALSFLVAGASAVVVSCSNTHDVEVWNGTVASKRRNTVSCSHSYKCNCHDDCTKDSKGNNSCHEVCSTCYEHSHDYDWDVYTSNSERVTISRVDRQGTDEPPRFASTVVGEPTSLAHSYTNYVKASPGTLFRRQGLSEKYERSIPAYPGLVYDYWRLDRLVNVGVQVADVAAWNAALSALNARLGAEKQANVVVVLTRGMSNEWFYALEEAWVGGKKNDVVLVVDVDDDWRPRWAQAMAWTDSELFKVKLRDDVLDLSIITVDAVAAVIERDVRQHYRRKPMADFEYLSSLITPSPLQWAITLAIALLVSAGASWLCHANDVFGDEPRLRRWAR